MISESARMSSTAEARFRVQAPNSTPRATTVIALDAAGEAVVRRLAASEWTRARFLIVRGVRLQADPSGPAKAGPHDSGPANQPPPRLRRSAVARRLLTRAKAEAGLHDLSGAPLDLSDEIDAADLVVLLAGPGGHAHAAPEVGHACSDRRVMTTGFIVGAGSSTERALSKTLAQVRSWSLMVVVANDDGYIDDMLRALRA